MINPSRTNGRVQQRDANRGEHVFGLGSPRAPGYMQPGITRKTVKELIMMKRQAMQKQQVFQQKCNPPQKKPRVRQPDFEPISLAILKEVTANETIRAQSSTPPPTTPGATNLFPPGPKNYPVPLPQQHVRCSAPTSALSPLADGLSKQHVKCIAPASALSSLADGLSKQHVKCSAAASALSSLIDGLPQQHVKCSAPASALSSLIDSLPQQHVRCSAPASAPSSLADGLPEQRVQCSALASALSSLIDGQSKQHVRCSAPTSALSPLADGKMTFFQWQILQEAQKMDRMDPEVLMTQDEDGDTFLHIAVAQGKRALAHVLASKMATTGFLDVKENKGQTALQLAAATNQHLIAQDLLFHGAQLNTADCWGRSPLHVCAEKGHDLTLQIIHRVLNGSWQPTDVERVNYDGLTPLHTATLCHNAVIKELRCLPAPPSHRAEELRLRSKMYGGCIRTLLLMGACCGTQDLKSGRTSLHMASEETNMDLLHIFLDQPSSLSVVNIKMFNGNTALHIASSLQNRSSQVEAVRLLLRRGADPSTKNNENELPAQLVPPGPVGDKVRQILKGKDVRS